MPGDSVPGEVAGEVVVPGEVAEDVVVLDEVIIDDKSSASSGSQPMAKIITKIIKTASINTNNVFFKIDTPLF